MFKNYLKQGLQNQNLVLQEFSLIEIDHEPTKSMKMTK